MAPRKRHEHDLGRDWATVALMLAAVGIALSGMRTVLEGFEWWIVAMTIATVMLVTGAVIRSFARHRLWGLLAEIVIAGMMITLTFAPTSAFLGIIPSPQTFEAFSELQAAGGASIAGQSIPARADDGIGYLLSIGVAALVFAMDLFASGARLPVLSGVSLIVLLLVPSLIDPGLSDPLTFALTASAYLGILLVGGRPGMLKPAIAVGAGSLAVALVLPFALPSVQAVGLTASGIAGSSVLNPIINLGNDLRRNDPLIAYTYSSTVVGGDYFRMTVLDDFTGGEWAPGVTPEDGRGLQGLGGVPGMSADVPTTRVTNTIVIGDIRTPWLPAPYAAQRVDGLNGDWRFDAESLTIGAVGGDVNGQKYSVDSVQVQPTIEQLLAAGKRVPAGFERYLELPANLPESVIETARRVAGGMTSSYDVAVALQDFFRNGDFTYSEEAPVEQGYDGSGASVLGAFLEVKAGYCVHFSSAMAAMARVLDIPARIAVGFTAGTPVVQGGQTVYQVTTQQFHAWPELYFDRIGWVRFEPTPGIGSEPTFAQTVVDDPATPQDESVPPPVTPPRTPPPNAAAPERVEEELAAQPGESAADPAVQSAQLGVWTVLGALIALLLVPAAARIVRRELRMSAVRAGSSVPALIELHDTAVDLGHPSSTTTTPRQFAAELVELGADPATVDRVATALEHDVYGPRPVAADVKDVRDIRGQLARSAGLLAGLAAVFVPRSLFAGWRRSFMAQE